jgi:hypothetical protein
MKLCRLFVGMSKYDIASYKIFFTVVEKTMLYLLNLIQIIKFNKFNSSILTIKHDEVDK